MRVFLLSLALVSLAAPAFAGTAYTPVKLAPAKTVTAPPELMADATKFLADVKKGDGDAIGAGFGSKITVLSGNLNLADPRSKEVMGPFKTPEALLTALGNRTGGDGDLPQGAEPGTFFIKGEREFIVQALTDGQPWGTDPMVKGATCSYATRAYDLKALGKVAKALGIESSGFSYVTASTPVYAAADLKSASAGALEPDLLYALDYETTAPRDWMAVHMPDGSSAFVSLKGVSLDKPYASGLCFAKGRDGKWVVVSQSAIGL